MEDPEHPEGVNGKNPVRNAEQRRGGAQSPAEAGAEHLVAGGKSAPGGGPSLLTEVEPGRFSRASCTCVD